MEFPTSENLHTASLPRNASGRPASPPLRPPRPHAPVPDWKAIILAFWHKPPAPSVIGVLTTPPPATWWKTNRHLVLLAVGIIAGFWLAVRFGAARTDQAPCTPTPRPSAAAPAHRSAPPHQLTNRP